MVELNHTIVTVRDKHVSAVFIADLLGLPAPGSYGPFATVETGNGVSLDFADWADRFDVQHYAFLVGDDEFDAIYGRIVERGLPHWADPHHEQPGAINHGDGGCGVYFEDPSGHSLEILTVPYGGFRATD
jgi:catechol 2,3-dioxygenase-like lactoylglutathione lyase family enzyme